MPTVKQQARATRIEAGTGSHNGVVLADTHAEAMQIIAAREAAGELHPDHGLLIAPTDAPFVEEWERRCRQGYYR